MSTLGDGHLWLHFTATEDWMGPAPSVPVLDRGEGCHLWDRDGRHYLDGLSALYCAQVGYGQQRLVEAATRQMGRLAFATNWGMAHQPAIDLAAALAERFPGDLDHAFFVSSGSEAVEAAMKLAIGYHRSRGDEQRTKVISRNVAYHGTTFGALGVTGVPALRSPFEPLRPGHVHVPATNPYRCSASDACPPCDLACARAVEQAILAEGPETVAAVIIEPVQNAGGSLTPPEGYLQHVREVCDRHGVLMVSDEVICGFGRLGTWTGAERYGYLPDMITFAKGITSAYAPMGGVVFRRHVGEAFRTPTTPMFVHGSTWGGHPVSAAVALANIELFESDDVLGNVRRNEAWFGERMAELYQRHHIVADVRGTGYFWALELARDRDAGVRFDEAERASLLRTTLQPRLRELGLICRADARDQPVLQLVPPLIASRDEIDDMLAIIDQVLAEATKRYT